MASPNLAFALLLAFASPSANGQIVKCTDNSGHVTYQQAPCAPGQQGRAVEVVKDDAPVDGTTWETAAAAGRVVPGMPKRWVLRARGTPAEIRGAGVLEQATEIWRYQQATTVLTVGFSGDVVAWARDEPRLAAAPASSAQAAPAAAGLAPAAGLPSAQLGAARLGADNRLAAEARSSITRGRACDSVLAALGPPARKESVQISAATLGGPDIAVAGTKYHYDAGGDANEPMAFTCLGGKVADVERARPR